MKNKYDIERMKNLKNNIPYLKGILSEVCTSKSKLDEVSQIISIFESLIDNWLMKQEENK